MRWAREQDFDPLIAASASQWNVPVALVKATIAVESGFNPTATNKADPGWAWGLMQMIPATARGLGYTGPMESLLTDPARAIDLGTQLLGQNLRRAGGSVADSASAYNGGFRPALGYGSTRADGTYANQAYVNKVLSAYQYFAEQGTSVAVGPGGGGAAIPASTFPVPDPDRTWAHVTRPVEAPVKMSRPSWWERFWRWVGGIEL